MKALEIVSEEDPQGTVVGVLGAIDLEPKQLLASGQVPPDQLFQAILADRDRMIDMIAERDQKIRELERALALKIEIMGQHFREAQP